MSFLLFINIYIYFQSWFNENPKYQIKLKRNLLTCWLEQMQIRNPEFWKM